jgi:hypothetical protein
VYRFVTDYGCITVKIDKVGGGLCYSHQMSLIPCYTKATDAFNSCYTPWSPGKPYNPVDWLPSNNRQFCEQQARGVFTACVEQKGNNHKTRHQLYEDCVYKEMRNLGNPEPMNKEPCVIEADLVYKATAKTKNPSN